MVATFPLPISLPGSGNLPMTDAVIITSRGFPTFNNVRCLLMSSFFSLFFPQAFLQIEGPGDNDAVFYFNGVRPPDVLGAA